MKRRTKYVVIILISIVSLIIMTLMLRNFSTVYSFIFEHAPEPLQFVLILISAFLFLIWLWLEQNCDI